MNAAIRFTAQHIAGHLREARIRELALFTDLSDEQLLGLKEHFLEPPIWEIGHVGWFQEYWILRILGRKSADS